MSDAQHLRRMRVGVLTALVALTMAWGRPGSGAPAEAPVPSKAVAIPDPRAVSVPDVAVAVRINRLDQLLPKFGALVGSIVPAVNTEVLKTQLGNALGDPALASLDQTRPILVCVFDPAAGGGPSPVALLPVTSDQLTSSMQARGNLVYQKKGGKTLLMTDAGNEKGMVAGRENYDKLEALLKEPLPSDVDVYVNVELLMTRHAAAIDAAVKELMKNMEQMQQMMGQPAGPNPILYMEIAGALGTIKELKDLGAEVNFSKEGVEAGAVLRAKPGTSLATLLDAGSAPDLSPLVGYVPRTGAVVGFAGGYDGTRWANFLGAKMDEALASLPQTTATAVIKRDALRKWIESSTRLKLATAFDFLTPGASNLLSGVIVLETSDANAYLNELKNLSKNLEATGMGAILTQSGTKMTTTFKEKVREYKGVPIHLLVIDVAMPQMGEAAMPMMNFMKNLMHQEYEIAVVDNLVVQDMGSKKIDSIIDALKAKKPLSPAPLNAQNLFPKGGVMYLDVLPARITSWFLQMAQAFMPMAQPGPESEQVILRLKSLETKPISLFIAAGQSKAQTRLSVPIEPIVKIKQAIVPAPPAPEPVAP